MAVGDLEWVEEGVRGMGTPNHWDYITHLPYWDYLISVTEPT